MMLDVIPTKDARLALDIMASTLERGVGSDITMNNSKSYVRMKALYTMNGVQGKFSELVLQVLRQEGKRQMYERQPYHVRLMAANPEDSLLLVKQDGMDKGD